MRTRLASDYFFRVVIGLLAMSLVRCGSDIGDNDFNLEEDDLPKRFQDAAFLLPPFDMPASQPIMDGQGACPKAEYPIAWAIVSWDTVGATTTSTRTFVGTGTLSSTGASITSQYRLSGLKTFQGKARLNGTCENGHMPVTGALNGRIEISSEEVALFRSTNGLTSVLMPQGGAAVPKMREKFYGVGFSSDPSKQDAYVLLKAKMRHRDGVMRMRAVRECKAGTCARGGFYDEMVLDAANDMSALGMHLATLSRFQSGELVGSSRMVCLVQGEKSMERMVCSGASPVAPQDPYAFVLGVR